MGFGQQSGKGETALAVTTPRLCCSGLVFDWASCRLFIFTTCVRGHALVSPIMEQETGGLGMLTTWSRSQVVQPGTEPQGAPWN